MKTTKIREWNEKVCYGFFCTAIVILIIGFIAAWFYGD